MKKNILISFLLLLMALPAWAQPSGERVEALKVAFITRQLNLNTNEAKVFWPVYDSYQEEKKEILRNQRVEKLMAVENFRDMSDEEMEKTLDKMMELKMLEAKLDLKYYDKFKKVLPIRKVAKLYRAEKKFTRMLLQGLQNNRANNGRRGGMR